MSGNLTDLLAATLAEHPRRFSAARGVERCGCGESTVGQPGWYEAHLAAALAAALPAAPPDTLAAVRALADEWDSGNPANYYPNLRGVDVAARLRAALAAASPVAAEPRDPECPCRCGRNDPCPDPWHDRAERIAQVVTPTRTKTAAPVAADTETADVEPDPPYTCRCCAPADAEGGRDE